MKFDTIFPDCDIRNHMEIWKVFAEKKIIFFNDIFLFDIIYFAENCTKQNKNIDVINQNKKFLISLDRA